MRVEAITRFLEPTIWHVHSTAHPAYQRHLNVHVKLQRIDHKSGAPVDYWKELHNDDHLWDCECMNTVLAVRQGLVPLLGSGAEQPELFQNLAVPKCWHPPRSRNCFLISGIAARGADG